MRRVLAVVLGIGLALNALLMLAVPAPWYAALPGVTQSGPFNAHFVRDIGAAYLVAAAALCCFAITAQARAAAQAGAAFLALHALVHLGDVAAGREQAHQLLVDLTTVFCRRSSLSGSCGRHTNLTTEKHHDQMDERSRVRAGLEL